MLEDDDGAGGCAARLRAMWAGYVSDQDGKARDCDAASPATANACNAALHVCEISACTMKNGRTERARSPMKRCFAWPRWSRHCRGMHCCLAASASALTMAECFEGSDFIANAARRARTAWRGPHFLGRLQEDIELIQAYPPQLRWFAKDRARRALPLRVGAPGVRPAARARAASRALPRRLPRSRHWCEAPRSRGVAMRPRYGETAWRASVSVAARRAACRCRRASPSSPLRSIESGNARVAARRTRCLRASWCPSCSRWRCRSGPPDGSAAAG